MTQGSKLEQMGFGTVDLAKSSDDEAKRIYDLITNPENDVATRMPESIFLEFLPMFAGLQPKEKEATLETWTRVAGGSTRRVVVVSNFNGEALFDVPPLLNRNAFVQIKDENRSVFSSLINAVENTRKTSPIAAEKLFADVMSSAKLESPEWREMALRDIAKWNEIFSRYGYPTLEVKTEPVVTEDTAAAPEKSTKIDTDDIEDLF